MTDFEEYVLSYIEDMVKNELTDYSWWDSEELDDGEFEAMQQIVKRIKLTLENK